MLTQEEIKIKDKIMQTLGVVKTEFFDVKSQIRQRVDYLKSFVRSTGRHAIVLGISGGVDSTSAGCLAQQAMKELREEGYEAKFIAMRLPYSVQKDEDEAQRALKVISPDEVVDVNIQNGTDGIFNAVLSGIFASGLRDKESVVSEDFAKGNVKARMRMISQYAVAGLHNGLVLGTDHNAENVTGFYTLHGDGACDMLVLNGLNKRQVRLVAKEFGAPEEVYNKKPTADLEDNNPQLADEDSLGITYEQIDDFLEGKAIDLEIEKKIIHRFNATEFKRRLPLGFGE